MPQPKRASYEFGKGNPRMSIGFSEILSVVSIVVAIASVIVTYVARIAKAQEAIADNARAKG